MKTRTATVLSIVGVLAAGSAAALVNTQVLETPSDSAVGAAAPASVVSTAPGPDVEVTSSIPARDGRGKRARRQTSTTQVGPAAVGATLPDTEPGRSAAVPSVSATATPTSALAAASARPIAYQVGSSGTVTLLPTATGLSIESTAPTPGWTVASASATGPRQIQVVFRSTSVEVTFTAAASGGSIVTDVTSRSLTPTSSGDDDHDDDHDDEDHGDEDHDDDEDHDADHDGDRGEDDDD